jgi:Ser/Thr protein kinase RdoA (MazF antagonist)
MVTTAPDDVSLATEIARTHWRISGPMVRTDLGISRITWRVGQQYWLSQSEESRSGELVRHAEVQQNLLHFLRDRQSSITVPEIVTSLSGDSIVTDRGYGWCLTRHLEGFHPDSHDPNIYPVLAEGLARFHRELYLFDESRPTRSPDGTGIRTRERIEELNLGSFVPFTLDPREAELLERASDWLLPRLPRFESLDRQIIHGDWTPRNVFFNSRDRASHLSAVLDFEAIATDPVHVDVANICSTLLMWSGLDRPGERMRDVLNAYENFSGRTFEREDIHIAMLSHWLCHYWNWRERLQNGSVGQQVKDRLCLRIASVLEFVARE